MVFVREKSLRGLGVDGGAEVGRGKIYKLISDMRGAKDSFQPPLQASLHPVALSSERESVQRLVS